jgi:hypothetical protein
MKGLHVSGTIFLNCANSPQSQGSVAAFPYSVTIDGASTLPSKVRSGAGVGKI